MSTGSTAPIPALGVWPGRALRLAVLAVLWWVIAGGSVSSWLIGLPSVLAAAWALEQLQGGPFMPLSPIGLVRFLPFFLFESLRGGLDVAVRTLGPRLRIRPSFIQYRIRLRGDAARVFFASCVSLLPGTLTADLDGDRLDVHRLSEDLDVEEELARLELAVARLFADDLRDQP